MTTPATPRVRPIALVVDDDPMMRLVAGETLARDGFEIVEATDGDEGLARSSKVRPDLVLLDVVMPKKDGFEMCASLRSRPETAHTPVLMMTGLDDAESVHRAYEVGATDFVTKPIHWELLGYRVRYLMRANRAFQDLARSEARLTKNQAILANAQRIARLGSWDWNIQTGEIYWSDEIYRIAGTARGVAETTFATYLSLVHSADRKFVKRRFMDAIKNCSPQSFEHRVVHADGTIRFMYVQSEVSIDAVTGRPNSITGTVRDITERRHSEDRIRQLAHYDSLTGLPNRQLLKERLELAIVRAERSGASVGVLFLDLDRFKRVNDTLGHPAGDELLQTVAARLMRCVRSEDVIARAERGAETGLVARLGGDEFIVVLEDLHCPQDANDVAQRLLEALAQPLVLGEHELLVSASIGIAVYPGDGNEVDSLLRNADTAMYHAKEQNRNNVQIYRHEMSAAALKNLSLEADLRHALARDELVLYYQPQIDARNGRVIGVEALIRWQHPRLGIVTPGDFVPLAEESGLIVAIGEWVLRTACAHMKAWQVAGHAPLRVSVNMSAESFRRADFVDMVKGVLSASGLDAHALELEVTESVLMRNVETTLNSLHCLKQLGIKLAIDDFGTGYSSLSYLKRFPIDTVKIDGSFVQDLPGDADDVAIAKAIIGMAHNLKLGVIAEGVETESQARFLQAHGCSFMQGYFFSRPLPEAQIADLLKAGVVGAYDPSASSPIQFEPALDDPMARAAAALAQVALTGTE